MPTPAIPVAVLGATGMVGQRLVQLLDGHPWFRVVALTGSERSAGRTYAEAATWLLDTPLPAWAASLPVLPTTAAAVAQSGARLAFSALPASVARQVEPALAAAGVWVCSNASAFRREPDVPLLMPEVNPQHIRLVETQRARRGWPAAIITNPNCSTTGLVAPLKALHDAFGVTHAVVVTLQALSGAGYPGVPALAIADNVIPYIANEEDKIEWEPRKLLGMLDGEGVRLADITLSASVHRVPVTDGHLLSVSLRTARPVSPAEAREALAAYAPPPETADLPSTPRPVLLVREEPDRPQPRLDRLTGRGMTTVVGRVRPDPVLGLKLEILSHNTVRGAAGGALYNGEWLARFLGWA